MPKYMFHAHYSADGARGLLREGGTSRRTAVEAAVRSLGGTLEAFYFAFGDTDAYAIVDLPDNASAASLSLTISAGGSGAVHVTVLITPEEADRAVRLSPAYRPPGG